VSAYRDLEDHLKPSNSKTPLKFETVTSGMCQTHYDCANRSVESTVKVAKENSEAYKSSNKQAIQRD